MNCSGISARTARGLVLVSFLSLVAGRSAARQQAAVPPEGATLRISLGLQDTATTPWDGKIELSTGSVLAVEVETPAVGSAEGDSWKLTTQVPATGPRPQPTRPVLLVALDAPDAASVSVSTAQGEFSFALGDLEPGAPATYLEGQVRIERMPLSVRLTAGPDEEDWPAAATGPNGAVWVAYMAYKHAGPLDAQVLHEERKFDLLKPEGNGDQLFLRKFEAGTWSEPKEVTEAEIDVWRPAVAVDRSGTVWVVWSQKVDANWDLYVRAYDPGSDRWGATRRVTDAPGSDIDPVAVADPASGSVYVAWQGWRDGSFDILLTSLADAAAPEKRLTQTPANEWWPAAACDSKGTLFVAFDTYQSGNYDVKLVAGASGSQPQTIDVAASPLFEVRPSIAVDKQDRVWVAYEEGGQDWGKDAGMKWVGRRGELLYWRREIVLRAVEAGEVRQAVGAVPSEAIARDYPDAKTRRLSLPRLVIDAEGRVWLLFRRHPLTSGAGEVWTSFVTHHTGEGWALPVELAHSENLMDNRPAAVPRAEGGLLVVHSTDGRTGGTQSAEQNDLFCAVVPAEGEAKQPSLVAVAPPPEPAPAVHPNEPVDLRRIRDYRATVGGKTYRLVRGEFHRHTELTSHRDQDGTLQDMWRYALDAASMDWIGNGDHDNGYGVEYLWWMVQKQTDIYHHPPFFTPMFTYERSVVYPSGHRNAMFARRGIRPLPRIPGGSEPLFGTPEEGSPDIKTFYAYLKHFDGICASHTSGTNMGTDWRDHDPDVEPVVEIYQGLRQSYEHEGAPATAKDAEDSIGGYRPAGFIWNALMKGYRLGFEVSSDHYSSHISYAMVWVEEGSREGILAGFKKRHSYGANDNIILDVRSGEHMMGDVFTHQGAPQLEISVIGTEPIARLSIIRGVAGDVPRYVYDAEPNRQEIKLTWTDAAPEWGRTNYYYVRVEQVRPEGGYGALAWASPMWIDVRR